jgi:hypothetical protein
MSKKLKLSPRVSYFLGMYAYSGSKAVGIIARNSEILQRFVEVAMKEFGIQPEEIRINEKENETEAYFYNTKLKKLLGKALERKEKAFAYKNAYAANYLAGIFDARGGRDIKGLFIKSLELSDGIIMERLGFHTRKKGIKTYITNPTEFAKFVKGHTSTL